MERPALVANSSVRTVAPAPVSQTSDPITEDRVVVVYQQTDVAQLPAVAARVAGYRVLMMAAVCGSMAGAAAGGAGGAAAGSAGGAAEGSAGGAAVGSAEGGAGPSWELRRERVVGPDGRVGCEGSMG